MHLKYMIFILIIWGSPAAAELDVRTESFGQTPDGDKVTLYTLTNSNKVIAGVIDYGATLVSIRVPDKNGEVDDILLGFDNLAGYLNRNFGGVTGRFANRIGGARFTIDGVEHKVTPNAGGNHIHGGRKGFDKVLWKGKTFSNDKEAGVRLTYLSKDGEEGYPGNLKVTVTYTLNDNNEVKINYQATTDKPTVLNLTNHAYFNLAGAGSGDVRNHLMTIFAQRYTVADKALIPTGEIAAVKNTPLDFTKPRTIGLRIDELAKTRGYDHNYVFDNWDGSLALRVRACDPKSGRVMEVLTTEPGMQLYTANHVNGLKGRDGKEYNRHHAFCIETQHAPDSPNKPGFPSVVLRPDDKFDSTTIFRFSAKRIARLIDEE